MSAANSPASSPRPPQVAPHGSHASAPLPPAPPPPPPRRIAAAWYLGAFTLLFAIVALARGAGRIVLPALAVLAVVVLAVRIVRAVLRPPD